MRGVGLLIYRISHAKPSKEAIESESDPVVRGPIKSAVLISGSATLSATYRNHARRTSSPSAASAS